MLPHLVGRRLDEDQAVVRGGLLFQIGADLRSTSGDAEASSTANSRNVVGFTSARRILHHEQQVTRNFEIIVEVEQLMVRDIADRRLVVLQSHGDQQFGRIDIAIVVQLRPQAGLLRSDTCLLRSLPWISHLAAQIILLHVAGRFRGRFGGRDHLAGRGLVVGTAEIRRNGR